MRRSAGTSRWRTTAAAGRRRDSRFEIASRPRPPNVSMSVADARAEQAGDDQRARQRAEYEGRRRAEIARDRRGKDRGQVVARRPRNGLRGAERER